MQARESERFELYNGVDEDWGVCWNKEGNWSDTE